MTKWGLVNLFWSEVDLLFSRFQSAVSLRIVVQGGRFPSCCSVLLQVQLLGDSHLHDWFEVLVAG